MTSNCRFTSSIVFWDLWKWSINNSLQ